MTEAQQRPGMQHFWSPPDGAPILSMAQFEGRLVVATATGVYVVLTEHDAPIGLEWTVHKVMP